MHTARGETASLVGLQMQPSYFHSPAIPMLGATVVKNTFVVSTIMMERNTDIQV